MKSRRKWEDMHQNNNFRKGNFLYFIIYCGGALVNLKKCYHKNLLLFYHFLFVKIIFIPLDLGAVENYKMEEGALKGAFLCLNELLVSLL